MNRKEGLALVKKYVKNKNSVKHMLAVEAVMRDLAKKFGEDEDVWGLAGLAHDIDMEVVDYRNDPQNHGKKGAKILKENGARTEVVNAALAHNKETGQKRESLLEKAIYCTDPLTGLIVASTLVLPSKKLSDLTPESVLKRYKEKAFAKGADREVIAACNEIGIELEDFIGIGLSAMKKISNDLGL